MKKREIITPEQKELETAVAVYAKVNADLVKTETMVDGKILAIREKYDEKLQSLEKERTDALDGVKVVADGNRESLFVKAKRVQTSRGTVGYRLGKPKLVLAEGKSWNDLADKVKELAPDYVRVKIEVAKDRLFADRELPFVQALLETIGVKVVQDEQFYVELK